MHAAPRQAHSTLHAPHLAQHAVAPSPTRSYQDGTQPKQPVDANALPVRDADAPFGLLTCSNLLLTIHVPNVISVMHTPLHAPLHDRPFSCVLDSAANQQGMLPSHSNKVCVFGSNHEEFSRPESQMHAPTRVLGSSNPTRNCGGREPGNSAHVPTRGRHRLVHTGFSGGYARALARAAAKHNGSADDECVHGKALAQFGVRAA